MKALVCHEFGPINHLRFGEMKTPAITSEEVLIKVSYCGVNFPDTLIVEGKYQFKPGLPFVPGGEVSGVVEQVGDQVKGIAPGDKVIAAMGWGGFAEFAVAKAHNTFHFHSEADIKKGSVILETYGTAIHALIDRARLSKGEVLVVLGAAGGTGTAAVQLGKVLGATVVAVAGSEDKLAFAKDAGADHLINYQKTDLKESLKDLGGVDIVFDPVGGSASEAAFRALKPGGRHLVVGFASGKIPNLPWNLPLLKSASIVGVFWGHFWRNQPDANRKNIEQLLKWLNQNEIDPRITKTFKLSEGVEALNMLKERKALGKIVLRT
ncbi:MAG: NADPH:quinone oxidoreductase family protein [Cyclobacteriaceae bacterium]